MRKLFDKKLFKFIIVGIINTLIGMAIMFGLYNLAGFSYWLASAANYVLTSILSFFLNKHFTFQNKDKYWKTALRFIVNIAACYLIAYGVAKPATVFLLSGYNIRIQENIAMGVGMVIFTGLNYLGQRLFAFREPGLQKESKE